MLPEVKSETSISAVSFITCDGTDAFVVLRSVTGTSIRNRQDALLALRIIANLQTDW